MAKGRPAESPPCRCPSGEPSLPTEPLPLACNLELGPASPPYPRHKDESITPLPDCSPVSRWLGPILLLNCGGGSVFLPARSRRSGKTEWTTADPWDAPSASSAFRWERLPPLPGPVLRLLFAARREPPSPDPLVTCNKT